MDGDAFVYVAKDSLAIIGSRPDYVEDPRYECIQVPDGLSVTALLAIRADDGSVTLVEDPAKLATKTAQAWQELRARRNSLLASCDWVALADANLSQERKDQWFAYRQELRDLPEEVTDPLAVVWPAVPGTVPAAPVSGSRVDNLLGQVFI